MKEVERRAMAEELDSCKNTILEKNSKISALEYEIENKYEVIAVNDMLHEDFKERVKDKYLYSSSDELSDYDSDAESRELTRQIFRKKKQEERLASILADKYHLERKCEECEFVGKTASGLKMHVTEKHGKM